MPFEVFETPLCSLVGITKGFRVKLSEVKFINILRTRFLMKANGAAFLFLCLAS